MMMMMMQQTFTITLKHVEIWHRITLATAVNKKGKKILAVIAVKV